AGMWRTAMATLGAVHQRLAKPPKGLDLAGAVQEYVAAYLELRELVPLSTVNTGEVSKATSGKGKGEETAALRAHAEGTPQAADVLAAQIVGLLDIRAVALACIESDPIRLAAMAPGLPAERTAAERAQLFVVQHLRSIQTGFPGALAAVAAAYGGPSVPAVTGTDAAKASPDARTVRANDEKAMPYLAQLLLERFVMPRAIHCLEEELPVLQNAVTVAQKQIIDAEPTSAPADGSKRKREPLDAGKTSKAGLLNLEKLYADEKDQRTRLNTVESALGLKPTPPLPPTESRRTVTASRRTRKPRNILDPADEEERQAALKHEIDVEAHMKKLAGPEEAASAADVEEEADRKGALAIQVIVSDAGAVTDVRSAGRPASPFRGTMGAHTTAWTVHVDRVRQLIIGRSLPDAYTAVTTDLAAERVEMAKLLSPAFQLPADSRPSAVSAASGDHNDLVKLQDAVVAHLEAVNLIAGAALAAADTGGKSEGPHRRVLLEQLGLLHFKGQAKSHPPAEVLAAIVGLLDLSSFKAGDAEKRGGKFSDLKIIDEARPQQRLALQHLLTIEATYPGALAAAGLTKPTDLFSPAVTTVVKQALADPERKESKRVKGDVTGADSTAASAEASASAASSGAATSVSATAASASSTSSSDSATPMTWEESIFGKAPTAVDPFGSPMELSGDLLSGFGTTLQPSPGHADTSAGWLDANGNLVDARLPAFLAAYRADIGTAGVYLAEAEGPAVAKAFGVSVDVYRDSAPPGFVRVENVGGGDCLIHALSDIAAAVALEQKGTSRTDIVKAAGMPADHAASAARVTEVRATLSAAIDDNVAALAVRDIVLSAVDGRGTPGLGRKVSDLLRSAGFQHAAAVVRGQRLRARAVQDIAAKAKPKEEAKSTAASAAVVAPIRPQVAYGDGAALNNYALLHTGGNHYVALVRTA
ncbi:MAG TPA: hypothetical protein VFU35_07300, partial [Jatrophihabitans sp.]|nr:hypothetical protein [Jatrophihabitans sp.]